MMAAWALDSSREGRKTPGGGSGSIDRESGELRKLQDLVRRKRGLDLDLYQEGYFRRRVEALVRSRGCSTVEEYAQLLEADPQELDRFVGGFLLKVTEFFRSPTTFEVLEKEILPQLISRKREEFSHVLRCWSAGCSSGEEPYSLAIVIREAWRRERQSLSALIFATDVDPMRLSEGRKGIYAAARLRKVKEEWRERYFRMEGDSFVVGEEIRRMVVFRLHNLQEPPPFRGLDLILFRNVLIYLRPELQRSVLEGFYQALNPGGYLVLGKTEVGAGLVPPLYELADAAERIYQRPVDS
jgi:chemotaxis methyl-accepting protein methylase